MPNKRRALLIGTSFSAAPLACWLKKNGWWLAVCGSNQHDPVVEWADAYHAFDYSDTRALLDHLATVRYDALIPSCNDYAYHSASEAASIHAYPGFDPPQTAAILANKSTYREYLTAAGLPTPRAWKNADELPTDVQFPLLVKPVDSFSGKGITRLESRRGTASALRKARAHSRSRQAIIEELIEGSLHSHSAFLQKQEISIDIFVDEFCTVYPYQVNCSNCPSMLPTQVRRQVRQAITKIARSLRLVDGLLHTQFIVRNGQPYLIESMRRCPGDLFYHLASLATGVDYIGNYVAPFIGAPFKLDKRKRPQPWVRQTISFEQNTLFGAYSLQLPEAVEVLHFPLRISGSQIGPAPQDKLGIWIARMKNRTTMAMMTEKLRRHVSVCTPGLTKDDS